MTLNFLFLKIEHDFHKLFFILGLKDGPIFIRYKKHTAKYKFAKK